MAIRTSIVLCLSLATFIIGYPYTQPIPNGCFHGGQLYQPGETFGDVCSPCRCGWRRHGRISCEVIDCVAEQAVAEQADALRIPYTDCPNVAVLLVCLVDMVSCSPIATSTAVHGCYHFDRLYQYGESFGSPCSPCRCEWGGRVSCNLIDCISLVSMCTDGAPDPHGCCDYCPNGPNCMAEDGTIVKDGDVYHPDPHTACSCARIAPGPGWSRRTICATSHATPAQNTTM